MGSELSTLGLFCSGRPPDLVRYRLAGGFGGAGFTGEGIGLDGEGSGAESGTGSFRRLFLLFEGNEVLAPRVRAISGYQNLANVADRRRLPEAWRRGSLKKTNSLREWRSDF